MLSSTRPIAIQPHFTPSLRSHAGDRIKTHLDGWQPERDASSALSLPVPLSPTAVQARPTPSDDAKRYLTQILPYVAELFTVIIMAELIEVRKMFNRPIEADDVRNVTSLLSTRTSGLEWAYVRMCKATTLATMVALGSESDFALYHRLTLCMWWEDLQRAYPHSAKPRPVSAPVIVEETSAKHRELAAKALDLCGTPTFGFDDAADRVASVITEAELIRLIALTSSPEFYKLVRVENSDLIQGGLGELLEATRSDIVNQLRKI